MEEDEELAEQESSRVEEVEEMVRDMVLVFFCTLWTLHETHQQRSNIVFTRSGFSANLGRCLYAFVRLTVPCFRRSRRQ